MEGRRRGFAAPPLLCHPLSSNFYPLLRSLKRASRKVFHLLVLVLATSLSSCGYYSFTGATIPSHLESIAVPLAVDQTTAAVDVPLNDELTDLLIARFVQQTRLALATTESEADVVLESTVVRYRDEPTAVGGGEQAALNRVSITVRVRYYDRVEDEELLAREFTSSVEYDPVTDGLQGEIDAARAALSNIADDVFTAATSDW